MGIAQKPEDKKKYDEILKKFADEDSLFHVPRRAHNGLFLYGDYFPQSQVSSYEITFRIAKSSLDQMFVNMNLTPISRISIN